MDQRPPNPEEYLTAYHVVRARYPELNDLSAAALANPDLRIEIEEEVQRLRQADTN